MGLFRPAAGQLYFSILYISEFPNLQEISHQNLCSQYSLLYFVYLKAENLLW
jgi:hypothetical protein